MPQAAPVSILPARRCAAVGLQRGSFRGREGTEGPRGLDHRLDLPILVGALADQSEGAGPGTLTNDDVARLTEAGIRAARPRADRRLVAVDLKGLDDVVGVGFSLLRIQSSSGPATGVVRQANIISERSRLTASTPSLSLNSRKPGGTVKPRRRVGWRNERPRMKPSLGESSTDMPLMAAK